MCLTYAFYPGSTSVSSPLPPSSSIIVNEVKEDLRKPIQSVPIFLQPPVEYSDPEFDNPSASSNLYPTKPFFVTKEEVDKGQESDSDAPKWQLNLIGTSDSPQILMEGKINMNQNGLNQEPAITSRIDANNVLSLLGILQPCIPPPPPPPQKRKQKSTPAPQKLVKMADLSSHLPDSDSGIESIGSLSPQDNCISPISSPLHSKSETSKNLLSTANASPLLTSLLNMPPTHTNRIDIYNSMKLQSYTNQDYTAQQNGSPPSKLNIKTVNFTNNVTSVNLNLGNSASANPTLTNLLQLLAGKSQPSVVVQEPLKSTADAAGVRPCGNLLVSLSPTDVKSKLKTSDSNSNQKISHLISNKCGKHPANNKWSDSFTDFLLNNQINHINQDDEPVSDQTNLTNQEDFLDQFIWETPPPSIQPQPVQVEEQKKPLDKNVNLETANENFGVIICYLSYFIVLFAKHVHERRTFNRVIF